MFYHTESNVFLLFGNAWFTLLVTVGDSACAGLSAMLAISVNQLMLEATTSARPIAKVNQHPTFAISLVLVAASIISWFTRKHRRRASASTVADSYD